MSTEQPQPEDDVTARFRELVDSSLQDVSDADGDRHYGWCIQCNRHESHLLDDAGVRWHFSSVDTIPGMMLFLYLKEYRDGSLAGPSIGLNLGRGRNSILMSGNEVSQFVGSIAQAVNLGVMIADANPAS